MNSAAKLRTARAFIPIGLAFLAIGASGQGAFIAIGISFIVIGAATTKRARTAPSG